MADFTTLLSNTFQTLRDNVTGGSGRYPLVEVKSTVDGKMYLVRNMADKQAAADLLARVRAKMSKMYLYLQEKFPEKQQVRQLVRNFQPDASRLLEATPDAEHTSYSVNKGEKIHLCLRQREGRDESLVEENVMVFVALHEMAHVITKSVGHGPDFWNNFGWLLKQAEAAKVYEYQDFKARPVAYCGLHITDSPSYDPKKDGFDFS